MARAMTRILLGFALVAGLLAGKLWLGRPRLPPRPNVVLITIDTLRADRIGAYGYHAARSGVIDKLAATGTVFLQATTPFPRTTPGLASLLTGLWPTHHGSREVGQAMRADVPTLAEILRAAGYVTVGVSANGAAGPHQKLDRGFDHFVDAVALRSLLASTVTINTLQLLTRVPEEKPVFLWVHYIDPHFPYIPPAAWTDQPDAPGCRALMASLERDSWRIGEMQSDRGGIASAVLDECSDLYDAEIAYTDDEVGKLLAGLEKLGRRTNSLVILTADHGENLGEDGLFYEHGPSVHDASLRVPLILEGPGIATRRDELPARLEDVMPTVLALLEVPRHEWPTMDGVELTRRLGTFPWPLLAEVPLAFAESGSALQPSSTRAVFSGRAHALHCFNAGEYSLCSRPGEKPGLFKPANDPRLEHDLAAAHPDVEAALRAAARQWTPEQVRQRTARDGRFKLVEFPLLRGGHRQALFDLEGPGGENRDVRFDHPDVLRHHARELAAWTALLPTEAPPDRTPEELKALRALGYVQ